VVSRGIVKVTAQFMASQDSQVSAAVDEKLGVVDVVFFRGSMEERCRGIGPAAAVDVHLQEEL
jgi:hypothetical protein